MNSVTNRLLILGLLIALLVTGGVYFYIMKGTRSPDFSDLIGRVYLTLSPKNETQIRLYTYDFETKKLKMRAPSNVLAMAPSLSPNLISTAFVSFEKRNDGALATSTQLYLRERATGEIAQLTKSQTFLKRMPRSEEHT